MNLPLELKIEDAIFRIKDLYDRTGGKCCLSFSGGKDSTIVANLYLIALERGIIGKMPIIFADTKIEYDAIYNFVKWFNDNKQEVTYLKPKKGFGQILKEYGKPHLSKMKSQFLGSYQKGKQYDYYYMKNMILGNPVVIDGKLIETKHKVNMYEKQLLNNVSEHYTKINKYIKQYNKDNDKNISLAHDPKHQVLKNIELHSDSHKLKSIGELVGGKVVKKINERYFNDINTNNLTEYEKEWIKLEEYQEYTMENDLMNEAKNQHNQSRGGNLVTGHRLKSVKDLGFLIDTEVASKERLANKDMHMLHPDYKIQVAGECCKWLKKKPFEDYYKENGTLGYLTGIRIDEGGVRAMQYKSCTSTKMINGIEMVNKMPIFDWSDKDCNEFIKLYDVKISDAYTVYGLDRTGCVPCSFSKDLKTSLTTMYKYEPKKYKACIHWLGDVYISQGIELPFDKEYTKMFNEQIIKIQEMRYQMMCMFRPQIAYKWKPIYQTKLF